MKRRRRTAKYWEVVWSGTKGRTVATRVRWDVRVTVSARDALDAADASRVAIVDTLPDEYLTFLILRPKRMGGPQIFTNLPSISRIPAKEHDRWVRLFRYEGEEADSPLASGEPYKKWPKGAAIRRPAPTRQRG